MQKKLDLQHKIPDSKWYGILVIDNKILGNVKEF